MRTQHKKIKGSFLQIFLPLILMVAAVGVGLYFLVFKEQLAATSISRSGDIASIYLIFLFFTPVFIAIALMILWIVINAKAFRAAASFFPKVREQVGSVNKNVRFAVHRFLHPIIEVDAHVTAIKHALLKKDKNGK